LDLTVQQGSIFGFLGPNGAGKTTTIRILTGLARPTQGRAWVGGYDTRIHGGEIARLVGYLPEEPLFYSWMTPREFLEYSGRLFGLTAAQLKKRVPELLDLAGLNAAAKRRIGGFSRGMRQRLGVAQALINQPQILLLDEPASALDPAGRREVLELIKEMQGNCTVLMSTHILADVERVCDRVGIISNGRLVAEASQEELLQSYAVPAFEIDIDPLSQNGLQTWAQKLRETPWITDVVINNLSARIVVEDVETAKRELLATTVQSGLILSRYEVARPSLEDVFLHLTGESQS
ncbi:MAG: ATP-binding cassette domain-containing protein, partial [Anaerolineales bacterium]